MISRNQAFIKALHKVFKDFGVRIDEYGSYADESYKCYFEGDDVNVLIEPNIFVGYDLTPDPEPPPPPPVIVEKLVVHKIDCSEVSDNALRKIVELCKGPLTKPMGRIQSIRLVAQAAIQKNRDDYVSMKHRKSRKVEHVLT